MRKDTELAGQQILSIQKMSSRCKGSCCQNYLASIHIRLLFLLMVWEICTIRFAVSKGDLKGHSNFWLGRGNNRKNILSLMLVFLTIQLQKTSEISLNL